MKVFQSFRLDPANQCLWRDEHRVPLTPKAFDVLRYLVEHPGRLVTQDELLEALWPETYVNPELIKKYILGIRKVLGDQHDKPVYIETLPKRGYQFIAPVTDHIAEVPQGSRAQCLWRILKMRQTTHYGLRGWMLLVFPTPGPMIGA